MSFIPGLGSFPEEGNGNPRQYSCLGNPTDPGGLHTAHGNIIAWKNPMDKEDEWTTAHVVARVGHDLVTIPPPPTDHI